MSLEKIEQLVERVNHAIKTIQVLKEERKKFVLEFNTLKAQNEKLASENSKLKQEKIQLEKNNSENIKLHKLLEEKIEEIIDSLPEDEAETNSQKTNIQNKSKTIKKEEIQKKAVVEKQIDNNSLFAFDKEEDVVLDNDDLNEETNSVDVKNKKVEDRTFDEDIKINFEDTLIEDEEEKEINFYIDNKSNINDDLPKGVL